MILKLSPAFLTRRIRLALASPRRITEAEENIHTASLSLGHMVLREIADCPIRDETDAVILAEFICESFQRSAAEGDMPSAEFAALLDKLARRIRY